MESKFHSGFVTVIGRPNVGKSTLINTLLKQKIAAVSPRPQTTRRRQLGILTTEQAQVIFVDTPGIHEAQHLLGNYMNGEALATLKDADVIVWMVDYSEKPGDGDLLCARYLREIKDRPPVILALNKVDLISEFQAGNQLEAYTALEEGVIPLEVSAVTGQGLEPLMEKLVSLLPEGPMYYDPDQITDLYEREIAADLIREAALLTLREEVPHSIAVRIDEYKERDETTAYIHATIFVERESHKGIVIGKGGSAIKELGTAARLEIEKMSGRKVFLELRVKVNKNWRSSAEALQRMGYIKSGREI